MEGDVSFQLEKGVWDCLVGGNGQGYRFQIPAGQNDIKSTKFESLFSEDPDDFGAVAVLNIEDFSGTAQLSCLCDAYCSEPILFRLLIEYEDGDIMRYYGLFDPKSALPPRGGGCEALYEINDGVGGEIVSGLSFIVVSCGGWEYYDGDKSIVGMEVYYKTQDGDKYPRNQTVFGPIQMTLPCGLNEIVTDIVGFGDSPSVTFTRAPTATIEVTSWTNDLEPVFTEAQATIEESNNEFLKRGLLYSTLKTMRLDCFLEGTFVPVDEDQVLNDILDNGAPTTIEDVLDEAPLLGIVGDEDPDRVEEVLDRYKDYLDVVGEQGDLEDGEAVSQEIIEGVAGILDGTNDDSVKDSGYDLLNDIQTTLLCLIECGEEPVSVESGSVTVGAQSGTLEQLAGEPISLGNSGAVFIFPTDLTELEIELGKDTCLYTGTSTVASGAGTSEGGTEQTLAASFTFYTINCTTGEREEVMVTTDGEFQIILPYSGGDSETDGCEDGNEDEVSCVSGDTLSTLDNELGCRVIEVLEEQIICGCRHLTAFSALFVPGSGGACGGEWEWGILQTIAASLIAFTVVFVAAFLIAEHFLVFKKRKNAIKSKTKRKI